MDYAYLSTGKTLPFLSFIDYISSNLKSIKYSVFTFSKLSCGKFALRQMNPFASIRHASLMTLHVKQNLAKKARKSPGLYSGK
jgi:hypothetical protein